MVAKRWLCTQAVFNRPQKLSIGELSQQLPLPLMDERTRHPAKAAWKSRLQYWAVPVAVEDGSWLRLAAVIGPVELNDGIPAEATSL